MTDQRSSKERVHWHDVLKKGGSWLAAARSAVQCSAVNGDSIRWGSNETVRGLTMRDVEQLAAMAVAAALNDRAADEPTSVPSTDDPSTDDLITRLRWKWADHGAGYNSEYTADLMAAADRLAHLHHRVYVLERDAEPPSVSFKINERVTWNGRPCVLRHLTAIVRFDDGKHECPVNALDLRPAETKEESR